MKWSLWIALGIISVYAEDSFEVLKSEDDGEILLSYTGDSSPEWSLNCGDNPSTIAQSDRDYFYLSTDALAQCRDFQISAKLNGVETLQLKSSRRKNDGNQVQKGVPLTEEQQSVVEFGGLLESRYENRKWQDTSYNKLNIGARGWARYSNEWNMSYRLLWDSSPNYIGQDPSQYFVQLGYLNWFRISGGDLYPTFSPYLLNGERIRGGGLFLANLSESFQFEVVYGINQSNTDAQFDDESLLLPDTATLTREDSLRAYTPGLYKRTLLGARISVGKGETARWNLGFVKAEDHVGNESEWEKNLRLQKGQTTTAADNLVLATDLEVNVWPRYLRAFGGIGLSLFTSNKESKFSDFAYSLK